METSSCGKYRQKTEVSAAVVSETNTWGVLVF